MKIRLFTTLMAAVVYLVLPFAIVQAETTDSIYYPVGMVSEAEQGKVASLSKGAVVIMFPELAEPVVGQAAEDMVSRNQVGTIVIAGVGSSSIGTAAFAKYVAMLLKQPVAGIVSSAGDLAVLSDGPKGFFVGIPSNINSEYYQEISSDKLYALYVAGARPKRLIGHSKGNFDLANTLFRLKKEGKRELYKGVSVITFGCGIFVPEGVETFKQYLGNLDILGAANTVNFKNLKWVSGAGHSINPRQPECLPIEKYIR